MYLAHIWGQVLELEEKHAIQDWTEVLGCWQNPSLTSDLRQTERVCQCTKPTEFRTSNNRIDCALRCLATQSCPALCDPIKALLSAGIPQTRILEWVAMPSSRGPFQPRGQTQVSRIAGGFFTIWATREAQQDRLARADSDCGGQSEVSREGVTGDWEILQLKSTESVDVSRHLLKIADFQTSSLDSFPKWGLHPFLKSL